MSCWCFVFSPRTYVSVFVTFMSWTLLFKPNEWMNEWMEERGLLVFRSQPWVLRKRLNSVWTDRDFVRDFDSGWTEEPCVRFGCRSLAVRGQLWGVWPIESIGFGRLCKGWAVQKQWTDMNDMYVVWRISTQQVAYWRSRWSCSPLRNLCWAWIEILRTKLVKY